jgi:hypothetical protein
MRDGGWSGRGWVVVSGVREELMAWVEEGVGVSYGAVGVAGGCVAEEGRGPSSVGVEPQQPWKRWDDGSVWFEMRCL